MNRKIDRSKLDIVNNINNNSIAIVCEDQKQIKLIQSKMFLSDKIGNVHLIRILDDIILATDLEKFKYEQDKNIKSFNAYTVDRREGKIEFISAMQGRRALQGRKFDLIYISEEVFETDLQEDIILMLDKKYFSDSIDSFSKHIKVF